MTKCKAILRAILMGITFSIFSPLCVSAQEKESEKPLRPVTSVFTVELGRQSALDTYLTPIRYWGLDVALGYERLRAVSFAPEKWFTRHNVSGSFASMTNQSGSGSMLSFYLDYSFAMLRIWQLLDGLYVSGGGVYNLRNSNNPATAKAAIDLGATAMASYHFYISRLPVTLRYQVSLPVIGTFFSPEFGQSYYEMFGIGNCSGIVHFGAWHNRVDVRNYISVDLHVGKRALRLGFVLGISGEIFRAAPSDRRIVSVYY